MTSFTIPKGVKEIRHMTFEDCASLTSMDFHDNIESIGYDALAFCSSLQSVTIGASVKEIDGNPFLSSYEFQGVKVSEKNPYYTSVNGILFTKDMTNLCSFPYQNGMTAYSIPDTVNTIGNSAFRFNKNLVSLTIPNSVKTIKLCALEGIENVTQLSIPEGIKILSNSFFSGCKKLTTVYLPASLSEVERSAFYDCKKLTDVYFAGSKSQWEAIKVSESYNDCLFSANIHFGKADSTTITLAKTSATIYLKGTAAIKATVNNGKGKTTYTSSNSKVARVSSKGVVTAVKAGKATITVKNNGVSKKFTVTVKKPTISPTKKVIKKGQSFTIKITGKVDKATFKTSSKKVATVNNKGKVVAKKKGKATITVATNGIKLKCQVTVR